MYKLQPFTIISFGKAEFRSASRLFTGINVEWQIARFWQQSNQGGSAYCFQSRICSGAHEHPSHNVCTAHAFCPLNLQFSIDYSLDLWRKTMFRILSFHEVDCRKVTQQASGMAHCEGWSALLSTFNLALSCLLQTDGCTCHCCNSKKNILAGQWEAHTMDLHLIMWFLLSRKA